MQVPVGGDEGLLIHAEGWIQLPRHLPGQAVDHLQQVVGLALLLDRPTQVQSGDVQRHGLGGQLIRGRIVCFGKVPEDHIVGVQHLRNADGSGARWLQIRGKAQMVVRVEPIAAVDGEKAGGR